MDLEKWLSTILTVVSVLVAGIAGWFKLKSEVGSIKSKLTEHIDNQDKLNDRTKVNIDRLYERERNHLEDVTTLKAQMVQSLENQKTILDKLNNLNQ